MIEHADCLEAMAAMPEASVDAVVTDPPYALGFMGNEWDSFGDTGRGARARSERGAEVTPTGEGHKTSAGPYLAAGVDSLRSAGHPFQAWCGAWATEALRVLKPGGHLLAFGGTRTYHRLTCAIEDAGFEIRDCLAWLYGTGFPKSMNVARAIDRAAGIDGEYGEPKTAHHAAHLARGRKHTDACHAGWGGVKSREENPEAFEALNRRYHPATEAARTFDGWGTALKPAYEPVVLARKPLAGTVAANVQAHGTGALNVDECRIEAGAGDYDHQPFDGPRLSSSPALGDFARNRMPSPHPSGRWPANVVMDPEAGAMLDESVAPSTSRVGKPRAGRNGDGWGMTATGAEYEDSGGPSRFFYCAKASRAERNAGLEGFDATDTRGNYGAGIQDARPHTPEGYEYHSTTRNVHPTVKPVALMRWFVRLIAPPGGLVLDPFAGSGTTGIACALEGFEFHGIEREAEYVKIAEARIKAAIEQPHLFDPELPEPVPAPDGQLSLDGEAA